MLFTYGNVSSPPSPQLRIMLRVLPLRRVPPAAEIRAFVFTDEFSKYTKLLLTFRTIFISVFVQGITKK